MYQNKAEDSVITPAHLMLIPLDSGNMANFLNFKNIGLNTLKESSAFAKIRNSTKVYNTHLIHTPSTFSNKYSSLNSMFQDENDYLLTSSFGVKKQHNLASATSLGNGFASSTLDMNSFTKFLNTNYGINTVSDQDSTKLTPSPLSLEKPNLISNSEDSTRLNNILNSNNSLPTTVQSKLLHYPNHIGNVNDNSDKDGLSYPIFKLSSPAFGKGKFLNSNATYSSTSLDQSLSTTNSNTDLTRTNTSSNSKVFNISGPNSKVLLGDQSIRSLPSVTSTKSNYNLSGATNTIASNLSAESRLNQDLNGYSASLDTATNFIDKVQFNNIASGRSFLSGSYPAVQSSLPEASNSLGYDSTRSTVKSSHYTPSGELLDLTASKKTPSGDVFIGSREKTPRAINTAYWSTFWATSNPTLRVNSSLRANYDRANFYLPTFSNYSDYDFRNDQAIDMLEELF